MNLAAELRAELQRVCEENRIRREEQRIRLAAANEALLDLLDDDMACVEQQMDALDTDEATEAEA